MIQKFLKKILQATRINFSRCGTGDLVPKHIAKLMLLLKLIPLFRLSGSDWSIKHLIKL